MTRRQLRRLCPVCGQSKGVTHRARRFRRHERAPLDWCPGSGQPAPEPAAPAAALNLKDVLMSDMTTTTIPQAWTDLISAVQLLATHSSSETSPFHCEHDELTVMADPESFTAEEIAQLAAWGFNPGGEGTFYSFRYGSA